MMGLIVSIIVVTNLPDARAQHYDKTYPEMNVYELKKVAQTGDLMAVYWLARKSEEFEEKLFWYVRYAEQQKTSRSTHYMANLYDGHKDFKDHQNKEQAYYWHYITHRLCKRESYTERWCEKAKNRLSELKLELPEAMRHAKAKEAKTWIRTKHKAAFIML